MLLGTLISLSYLVTAAVSTYDITPVDENTQIRLQGVVDGLDSRGEGFAALIDHVQQWEGLTQTVRAPNIQSLLNNPRAFRGNLFEVSGVIELVETMPAPWAGVDELFVRDASGNVFGLYVVGQTQLSPHHTLKTPAVFYKTMSIEGRDNQLRLYPTFVTVQHVLMTSANLSSLPSAMLIIPIACAVAFALYVFVRMTKSKKDRIRQPMIQAHEVLEVASENASDLPDNPSEALATLYARSEESE